MDEVEELKSHILGAQTQEQLFNLMAALLEQLPYDWLDKEDNWLAIAHHLNQYGHSDLADIFELANGHCFQLMLKES